MKHFSSTCLKWRKNSWKYQNAKGQGYDCTTGCLPDNLYFKEHYKLVAIDLIKKQANGDDPKAIQEINSIGNLDREGNTTMLFIP